MEATKKGLFVRVVVGNSLGLMKVSLTTERRARTSLGGRMTDIDSLTSLTAITTVSLFQTNTTLSSSSAGRASKSVSHAIRLGLDGGVTIRVNWGRVLEEVMNR